MTLHDCRRGRIAPPLWLATFALMSLAWLSMPVQAAAFTLGPGPDVVFKPDGSVKLPQPPSTLSVHGPILPTDDLTQPVVVNARPKTPICCKPPVDDFKEALLDLVYDTGPTSLKLNVVVPDGLQSLFAGFEAQLLAARPTTALTLQFITPQQMNSCSVSVGLPGPGGGTTFVNTCEPHAVPARPAGQAEAWYVGLFDLWAFEQGGQTYDLSPYVYSLINASDLLYLDVTELDRATGFHDQQARFNVRSFEFDVGPNRTLLNARFVDAQRIPEPATGLMALSVLAALAFTRRGRRRANV